MIINLFPNHPPPQRYKIRLNFKFTEGTMKYDLQYNNCKDYSLAIYPLWIVINNRLINENSRYELHKVYNADGIRGFYRGFVPYFALSIIMNGHFRLLKNDVPCNDPEKTRRML